MKFQFPTSMGGEGHFHSNERLFLSEKVNRVQI